MYKSYQSVRLFGLSVRDAGWTDSYGPRLGTILGILSEYNFRNIPRFNKPRLLHIRYSQALLLRPEYKPSF